MPKTKTKTKKSFRAYLEQMVQYDTEDKNYWFAQSDQGDMCPVACWLLAEGLREVSVGYTFTTYRDNTGRLRRFKNAKWLHRYVTVVDEMFKGDWVTPRQALTGLD